MRKVIYLCVVLVLTSVAGVFLMTSGYGPSTLPSEKTFMAGLHNSLYYLDQAKSEWAREKMKPEQAIPALEELKSYLGENVERLERMKELGVTYQITSMSENQSDIATLNRCVRFRGAVTFSHFYPAGTKYCLHGFSDYRQWHWPPRGIYSRLFQVFMIAHWALGIVWSFRSIRSSVRATHGSVLMGRIIFWTLCTAVCLAVNGFVIAYLCHWFTGVN